MVARPGTGVHRRARRSMEKGWDVVEDLVIIVHEEDFPPFVEGRARVRYPETDPVTGRHRRLSRTEMEVAVLVVQPG